MRLFVVLNYFADSCVDVMLEVSGETFDQKAGWLNQCPVNLTQGLINVSLGENMRLVGQELLNMVLDLEWRLLDIFKNETVL